MTNSIWFLSFKRLLALGALCYIVFAAWFYHTFLNNPFDDWWFDQKIWKSHHETTGRTPRGKMAYDLRHRVLKPKMMRKEVLMLLGKPDNISSDSSNANDAPLSYDLGSGSGCGIDPAAFVIEFDKSGHLVKAYWYDM